MVTGAYFLLVLATLSSAFVTDNTRQRRSFNLPVIGSWFGGEKEPDLPHLGQYPLWKVHRYHGISLQPIPLPSEEVPSSLPITHHLPGEAPSIVNVPDPYYVSKETIPVPLTEYEHHVHHVHHGHQEHHEHHEHPEHHEHVEHHEHPEHHEHHEHQEHHEHHHSAPYPLTPYPSAPYPAPSHLEGPYPPSGPYPSHHVPTAPHAPVFHASSHHEEPRGHISTHSEAAAVEFVSPPHGSSHTLETLTDLGAIYSAEAGHGPEGSLSSILSVLPPEMVQRLHVYISTPEGRERFSSLLDIISNARKLKTNAAHSLQEVFQRFFGGAGGSTKVALESGTYTHIPKDYPATLGVFNNIQAVGTGISGSPIPELPEAPELPKVPGLHSLPPTPKLPHINLPAYSPLPPTGGQYVSISLPEHHSTSHSFVVPEEHHHTYEHHHTEAHGVPAHIPIVPSTSYGVPSGPIYPYPGNTHTSAIATSFHHGHHSEFRSPVDSSLAGTETQETFNPSNPQPEEGEGSQSSLPLTTTKLQRAPDSSKDEVRVFLGSNNQAPFKPSYQERSSVEDNLQEDDILGDEDIPEDNE